MDTAQIFCAFCDEALTIELDDIADSGAHKACGSMAWVEIEGDKPTAPERYRATRILKKEQEEIDKATRQMRGW